MARAAGPSEVEEVKEASQGLRGHLAESTGDGATTLRATGTYRDQLIYERGGWYFTSRELEWDSVSNGHSLTV